MLRGHGRVILQAELTCTHPPAKPGRPRRMHVKAHSRRRATSTQRCTLIVRAVVKRLHVSAIQVLRSRTVYADAHPARHPLHTGMRIPLHVHRQVTPGAYTLALELVEGRHRQRYSARTQIR
jgi:hypothetical protein